MLGEGRASVAHLNHPYGMGAKWYRLAESGRCGGEIGQLADVAVTVPADQTARIQELHILLGHIICQAVEDACTPGFERSDS